MEVRVHSAKDAMNYIIPKVAALCDDFTTDMIGKQYKIITMDSPTTMYQRNDGSVMLREEHDTIFHPYITISLELITDKEYYLHIEYDEKIKENVISFTDELGNPVNDFQVSPFNPYLTQFLAFYNKLERIIYDTNLYMQMCERDDVNESEECNMNEQYQRGDVFRIQFLDNETLQTIRKAENIDEGQLTLGGRYTAIFENYHADQELLDFAILGNNSLFVQVRIKKSEIDDKRISAKCVWKCPKNRTYTGGNENG